MKTEDLQTDRLPAELASLHERYGNIHVIVSPPRCSSTAFARVFWEQPSIRYYSHEPFEITYYRGQDLSGVVGKLDSPLDLKSLKNTETSEQATSLTVKEMPYQVGDRFPLLAAFATPPITFLMRDPRQSIASRMRKKLEVGADPNFPRVETGWELLSRHIDYCHEREIPHQIVDSADFRNHPEAVFSQVFELMGLPFSAESLTWRPCGDVALDNLDGQHRHLYERVLLSRGILPATEEIPPLDSFSEAEGLRDHVARCLDIYRSLRVRPERVRVAEAVPEG